MKTLFLRLILLVLAVGPATLAQAQAVANSGFETWALRNGTEAPTGWLTTDDVITASFGLSLPSATYTKTTDAHGGTYAVRLETKATLLGTLPGAVGVGTQVGRDVTVPGGTPFTGRPALLQFYYRLSGPQPAVASNGAFAQVALTRTVNGVSQAIATAKQVFTTVTSAYVLAQVPLTYTSAATPDTLRLVLSSGAVPSATGAVATVGTVFQVDDLAFTGTATATRRTALGAALTVFPNPGPAGRFVLAASPALLAAPLVVVDATGRVVWREAASPQPGATRALDLPSLSPGIYILQLLSPEGLLTKRLVVY